MKRLAVLMVLFLAGCTASQEDLDRVAEVEAAGLPEPSKPLSSFAAYELKAMTFYPEVGEKPEKVEQAGILEAKLKEKVLPLFDEWSSSAGAGRSGTLVVQPEVVQLRIVSGGARFFAGAWSGESFIVLDLTLTDGDTGNQLVKTRIRKAASAMGGAWSVGQTDANLHDYMAHITHRYLVNNY